MSQANLLKGGGGGVSSDDVTATKAQVLKGCKTITADSDDEIVEGTLPTISGTTLTPTTSAQTYYCAGYYITGNIAIGAIPDSIVDLTLGCGWF